MIADAYQETAIIPATDFGGRHIDAQAQPLYRDIPDAKTAASSEDAFGTLLWLVSTSQCGELVFPLRIPCAAFVKRPAAIVWLMPRWGGAIDSDSPESDCAESMPPLPSYIALANEAQTSHPMEGTIRFSVGAGSAADYAGVLTQSLKYLHVRDYGITYESAEIKAFKNKHLKAMEKATNELIVYYEKYFSASPETAERDAQAAISALLSNLLSGDE